MTNKKLMAAVCSAVAGAACFTPSVTMASPVAAVEAAAVVAETASKVLPTSGDFSVEARAFSPSFDVKAHSDSIDYKGGDVSLKDDLGFSDKTAPELVFRYRNLSADWIHVSSSGDAKLQDDMKIDDKTFLKGSGISADSKLNYINVKVTNPLVSVPHLKTTWNYGLSVINWKMSADGTVAASYGGRTYSQSESASESYTVPVPLVGLGAEADLGGGASVYAKISGLPLASYGHVYDLETGVKYSPIPYLTLDAGYRRVDINVHHDDDRGSFVLSGPWAGLSYNF